VPGDEGGGDGHRQKVEPDGQEPLAVAEGDAELEPGSERGDQDGHFGDPLDATRTGREPQVEHAGSFRADRVPGGELKHGGGQRGAFQHDPAVVMTVSSSPITRNHAVSAIPVL